MYNVVQLDNKNDASLMKESTAGKGPPQVLYKDKKYVPTRINPAAYGGLHEFMLRGNSVKLWYGVEDLRDFFPNMKEYNGEYANKFLDWVMTGKVRIDTDTGRAFRCKRMTKQNVALFEKYMGAQPHDPKAVGMFTPQYFL